MRSTILAGLALFGSVASAMMSKNDFLAAQREAVARFKQMGKREPTEEDLSRKGSGNGFQNITFTNPLASRQIPAQ